MIKINLSTLLEIYASRKKWRWNIRPLLSGENLKQTTPVEPPAKKIRNDAGFVLIPSDDENSDSDDEEINEEEDDDSEFEKT